ncbi:MAG: DUF1846 domain-containing protein [Lentisphaerae bacterium]|nr:DUF1846 domain-containing protein [Lentisphaerota bacterium]
MKRIGFDNEKYLEEQSKAIVERAEGFGSKLYLEFGGKLLFDMHAARVLPGFDPNVKMRLLQRLKDRVDIVLCIHAGDIERKKLRADFGITYDVDALKLIDDLRDWHLDVAGVVITRYDEQPSARQFMRKLEQHGMRTYTHRPIKGYPAKLDRIVSDEGYGANEYIETTKPIVVVTAPGPGSGKMGTCLSQLYHDHQRGEASGYAKFETFPIWNLPVKHPVNIAYEAATCDLADFNLIDPHHLEAHGETAVNYNRDVEAFPLLKHILQRIMGEDVCYQSPTDMGVNRAGFAISDDETVREAANQEIIRRYFRYHCEYAMGFATRDTVDRIETIMESCDLQQEFRVVVGEARDAALSAQKASDKGHDGVFCGAALELEDGTIVQGRNSPVMHAASSVVLNATKRLSEIPHQIPLLSESVIESISRMKQDVLGSRSASLSLDETLIALAISATQNPTARIATEKLAELRGREMHLTHMPTPGDEAGLRRLGVNLTSDPNFASRELFVT